MLKDYDELGRPYPYPLQAIRFGNDLTLLALGGEVVVEYQLWAKKQFGADGLVPLKQVACQAQQIVEVQQHALAFQLVVTLEETVQPRERLAGRLTRV